MADIIQKFFANFARKFIDMGDGTHAERYSVMPPLDLSDRWWSEFYDSVGLGLVPGATRVAALGNNPDVDTGVVEDVWSGGGIYPWMTGATMLEMVSTSANDSAAGTGARTVLHNPLDTSYIQAPVTLTLNGLTPVAFPAAVFRYNSGLITSAGSGKTNAGDIIIRDAGGGTTRAIIPAGYGITRQAVFTVPAGKTACINSQFFCINRTGGVSRYATFANFIQTSSGFYRMPLELSISERAPYRHDGLPSIILGEKTDYAFRCSSVSNDNTDVTAAFLGVLIDNAELA